ncbi:LAME_0C07712g1_1 [Lachancea meyersii CBS 8951]|uniref:LAME_0C07712g1_1 n=1 Tax=Lachancea meyersii CBS 8951 TaxID=1266667 RepID=A0A1G4J2P8_9SACH|nr:LAME_0C07712g1_1 [Lachancea meyersii CBS 8951]
MEFDERNEEASWRQVSRSGTGPNDLEGLQFVGSHLQIPDSLVDYTIAPVMIMESEASPEALRVLSRGSKALRHVLKSCNETLSQWYVLENYVNKCWLLWTLIESAEDKISNLLGTEITSANGTVPVPPSVSYSSWIEYKVPDLLKRWAEDTCLHNTESSELMGEVSMRPSRKVSTNRRYRYDQSKSSSMVDPKTYLQRKYYEALFSLRIPLAYFVKSNLVRTKLLSQGPDKSDHLPYQMHLADLTLDIENFDKRQSEGLLVTDLLSEVASEIRINCLNKLENLIKSGVPTVISDLLLVFKVREIKLQIILLLELIALNGLDSKLDNFEVKYKTKLKKRVKKVARAGLSSRYKKKDVKAHTNTQQLDYCEKLDVYVDKLCIIDAMLLTDVSLQKNSPAKIVTPDSAMHSSRELKKNMLDPEKEASASGFITYVLIPYFKKKAPHAVAFVSRKLKGPHFEALSRTESKRSPLNAVSGTSNPDLGKKSDRPDSPASQGDLPATLPLSVEQLHPPSKIYMRASLPRRPSILNSRSNSQLSEILDMETGNSKKYGSVTRGNSDLFLSKLQKRQLPATDLAFDSDALISRTKSDLVFPSETEPEHSQTKRKTSTATFIRTTRRKIEPKKVVLSSAEKFSVQVEATPHGKRPGFEAEHIRNPAIIESPLASLAKASPLVAQESMKDGARLTTPSRSHSEGRLQVPASDEKITVREYGYSRPLPVVVKKKVRRRLFAPE